MGPLYLKIVGAPSLIGSMVDYKHMHKNEWYEVWANNISYDYHDKYDLKNKSGDLVRDKWERGRFPLDFIPDWYFYSTLACYPLLLFDRSPFSIINIFF